MQSNGLQWGPMDSDMKLHLGAACFDVQGGHARLILNLQGALRLMHSGGHLRQLCALSPQLATALHATATVLEQRVQELDAAVADAAAAEAVAANGLAAGSTVGAEALAGGE